MLTLTPSHTPSEEIVGAFAFGDACTLVGASELRVKQDL